jgi:hypothetical protein
MPPSGSGTALITTARPALSSIIILPSSAGVHVQLID